MTEMYSTPKHRCVLKAAPGESYQEIRITGQAAGRTMRCTVKDGVVDIDLDLNADDDAYRKAYLEYNLAGIRSQFSKLIVEAIEEYDRSRRKQKIKAQRIARSRRRSRT